MSELESQIRTAKAREVAGLLGMETGPSRVWRPEELAAIFEHQMTAPVAVDLGSFGPETASQISVLAGGGGLLLKSFRDLFTHPQPPLELLRLVKDFAKLNLDSTESLIPCEIAMMLYYLSIAAALACDGERISSLGDADLKRGLVWGLGQDWLDEPARELLRKAADVLEGVPK